MEGIGHGKATLGEFGGSAGGDVTFFLTVEAENFPLAGKRLQYFVEPLGIEVGQHGKLREVRAAIPGQLDLHTDAILVGSVLKAEQGGDAIGRGIPAAQSGADRVEHYAARYGTQRRKGPHDAVVAEHAHQRLVKPDFAQRGFAGAEFVAVEEIEPGGDFAGFVVEMDFGAVAQGAGRGTKAGQPYQPAIGREQRSRQGQHVAALHIRHIQTLQVDGGTVAGFRHFHGFPVALQAAGAGSEFFREQFQRVAHFDRT